MKEAGRARTTEHRDMATAESSNVKRRLHQGWVWWPESGPSDGQLLEGFVACRDEAAFAALVRRHGAMVFGVCRRLLGNAHDAEDAFQATFLVLARKAAAVVPRERVGNWLHGVARRTALEARSINARRALRERQFPRLPERVANTPESERDLPGLLDQELSRLPDKYRAPVILCELEGRSRRDVARQLEIPEGTLSSRLATARKLLAARLTRRGLVYSAEALAVVLAQSAASASVPMSLVVSSVQAATSSAAGETAAGGLVSANVAVLVKGVTTSMFLSKLKIVAAACVALGLVVGGTGTLLRQALADRPEDPALVAQERPAQAERPQPVQVEAKAAAQQKEKDKGKGGNVEEAVKLTGVVHKKDEERKLDGGGKRTVTLYHLQEEKGNKVQLPSPRRRENGDLVDKFDLDDYVGKQVVITGRAITAKRSERPDAVREPIKMLTITEIKLKK
jgi:RNA polymerase sigma factor (sigma-70 family)